MGTRPSRHASGIDRESLLSHDGFIRSLAHSLVADEHKAEEIAQLAWLELLRAGPRKAKATIRWLQVVVKNLVLKLDRGEKRRVRREHAAARPERVSSAAELIEQQALRQKVIEAVLSLREPYRTVIVQHHLEGVPTGELAAMLGVPVETVRTRLKRGLRQLRSQLDRMHNGDRRAWVLPLLALDLGGAAAEVDAARLVSRPTWAKLAAGALLVSGMSFAVWRLPSLESAGDRRDPTVPGGVTASRPSAMDSGPRVAAPSRVPSSHHDPAPTGGTAGGSLVIRAIWAEDRQPAADVGLRLSSRDWPDHPLRWIHGRTGQDGIARFRRVPPGRVQILGDRGGETLAHVEEGRESVADFGLPRGMTVEGVVVDREGAPVWGAEISFPVDRLEDGRGMVVARTDQAGRFAIRSVSMFRLHVVAWAPGHAASDVHFVSGDVGTRREVRLVLPGPGAFVAGQVLDPSGGPVPAAIVRVGHWREVRLQEDGSYLADSRPVIALTDDCGRFRIDGLRPGEAPLVVRALGLSGSYGHVLLGEGIGVEKIVKLEEGASVHGTVTDALGRAAPGVRVCYPGKDVMSWASTSTGQDGSYRLVGLVPGEGIVRAVDDRSGCVERKVRLVPGGTAPLDLVLEEVDEVVGRVVDEKGLPIQHAVIHARPLTYTDPTLQFGIEKTDRDGRFRLSVAKKLRPCKVSIHDGSCEFPSAVLKDPSPCPEGIEVCLRAECRASAFVTGIVLDPQGKPAGRVEVSVINREFAASRTTLTDEGSGKFLLGPFPPGRYVPLAKAPGFGRVFLTPRTLCSGETLDVGAVKLETPGTLAVTVRREDGKSADETFLPMVRDDGQWMESLGIKAGTVHRILVAPGRYALHGRGKGLADDSWPFEVKSGAETRVDVVLRPGITVKLRFHQAQGQALPETIRLSVRDEGHRLVFDGFALLPPGDPSTAYIGLREGSYCVTATASSGLRGEAAFAVGRDGVPNGFVPIDLR